MADKISEVLSRVADLGGRYQAGSEARTRIRALMNGGEGGLRALLGDQITDLGSDLPVANYMLTAMTRLAQKVGRPPTLKIEGASRERDSQAARDAADKRERIVSSYDDAARLGMQLPQVGRWLPGYGFCVWVVRTRRNADGTTYPHAELRDPYDVVVGSGGPDQRPTEMASFRLVDRQRLSESYPKVAPALAARAAARSGSVIVPTGSRSGGNWEGGSDVEVVEYYDATGTYMVIPEVSEVVDFVANPLRSGPAFVVAKRFSFDQLQGHYDQLIGLMAQIAKMNILAVIAAEDEVFTETNVIGQLLSGDYGKGRNVINLLEAGSRVERPARNVSLGVFAQIDRLERQLRLGASYPVSDDAEAGNRGWVTGRGQSELKGSVNLEIDEYHLTLADAIERLDGLRLEWDETMWPNERKPLATFYRGAARSEEYTPGRDIAGHYRTRRVYGVMAGWDEPQKIVTGLQLLQAEIIDPLTLQENLDGLEGLGAINDRIRERKAEDVLFGMLATAAGGEPPDPRAQLALVEIRSDPHNMAEILRKFFTPQEPQTDPTEEQFLAAAAAGPGGGGPPPGPPPSVSTVLSRLELGGGAEGGIQTVGRL